MLYSTVITILLGINVKPDGVSMDCTLRLRNSKGCQPRDQFPLTNGAYVTVCTRRGVDIRHYINDKVPAEGVHLNQRQWVYLKRSMAHIDRAISTGNNTSTL